jgi:hypothetical protein
MSALSKVLIGAAATVAAGVALALLAGPASAAVFCAPAPCSPGTPAPSIEQAVDAAAANPGPDTVRIGSGVHTVSAHVQCGGGVFVGSPETELIGAGAGETVITAQDLPPDAAFTRAVVCGYMSRLANLTIRLPSAVTSGNASARGADVYDGTVENVRVDAEGASFGPEINDGEGQAMLVRGGAIRDVEVDLPVAADTEGVSTLGAPSIESLTVRARRYGLNSRVKLAPGEPPMRARGLRLHAHQPLSVLNETDSNSRMAISDALLDASVAPASEPVAALTVVNGLPPHAIAALADRVTMIGNGNPESVAIQAFGQGTLPPANLPTALRARHLLADGFPTSLLAGLYGSDVDVRIAYSNMDLSPGKIATDGTDGQLVSNFGPGNRAGPANLLAPGASDFRLTHRSPGVDIGGPPLLAGTPTDLAGAPRPVDGDGNGSVEADAGAFEHQNNNFRLLKLKRNKRKGTAKLTVGLPAAGKLELVGKKLQPVSRSRASAGKVKLTVKTRRKARKKLKRRGRLRVRATLDFTSPTVLPRSKSKRIKLVRKRR